MPAFSSLTGAIPVLYAHEYVLRTAEEGLKNRKRQRAGGFISAARTNGRFLEASSHSCMHMYTTYEADAEDVFVVAVICSIEHQGLQIHERLQPLSTSTSFSFSPCSATFQSRRPSIELIALSVKAGSWITIASSFYQRIF